MATLPVRVQFVFIVLPLISVCFTNGFGFTITPTPVAPGGRVVLNCTLPTGLTEDYQLRVKDQDGQVLVLFYKGHTSLKSSHLLDYKDRISKINHPDETKTWASFAYQVPWCYEHQQFTCHVLDHVIDDQVTQNLTIQYVAAPKLYHEDSCLTCDTPVVPLVLDSINDTALECRLDGVTEASRLVWSNNYFLVPETNLTSKDSEKCIYNYTATGKASRDSIPGETVDVFCTAVTSTGQLNSTLLKVQIGRDMDNKDTGKGKTGPIVLGIVCVVIVLAAGTAFIYRRSIRAWFKGVSKPPPNVHDEEGSGQQLTVGSTTIAKD